ncbi:virion morphogenesis protein [Providencia stuartii]|uniref:Virion morphogenesis protein n=1 Tax=Providencia stuartii TaxID=588 RepID=A0A1S1HWZ5_PROST|nr:virion morphogenesis protein [Providencia stuartii]
MASITINFQAQSALTMLRALKAAAYDVTPMLEDMGEELLILHQDRFRVQQAPDGTPWAALRPWYRDSKSRNADKILTLTGQLQDTLRWQIQGDILFFGTDRPYGAIHQFGGTIVPKNAKALNVGGRPVKKVVIPARPWLGLSRDESNHLLDIAREHLQGR